MTWYQIRSGPSSLVSRLPVITSKERLKVHSLNMRRTFLTEHEFFDMYHGHPIDPQLYFALDLLSVCLYR